jgi:ATP-binding cassette subfamily B protein
VQASLNQFMAERTTLVIAHRLKTILRAQRIIVLNKGRIEAIGTHGELVSEENNLYHQMIQADFAAEVTNQRRLGIGL